ncbi:MAG: NAD+ synthase [Candidatus Bipolaricaulota bacterium]|nr:NAD+ synthase [Candidatus Bipolaricaulota bacterium]
MRVGIGQMNAHVGAIERNAQAVMTLIDEAKAAGCDVVAFPELAIPGYIPLDLLWRPGFVSSCEEAVAALRDRGGPMTVIVGSVAAEPTRSAANRSDPSSMCDGAGTDIANVAHLLAGGREIARVAKIHLPTFDVYSEKRYFTPGEGVETHDVAGTRIGVNLCEDLWIDEGPTDLQASLGAKLIFNLSASPFFVGKLGIRRRLARRRAQENGVAIVYVNLVGGQDDIVFDGGSFVVNEKGDVVFAAPRFEEGLYVVDLPHGAIRVPPDDPTLETRSALVLGIRDYVRKNGFRGCLLGLSGGIDSAVVAALAAEAVGAENVVSVYMPSKFSAQESGEDAAAIAAALGIRHLEISIAEIHERFRNALPNAAMGLVDENLQPRIRGILLMALSTQEGRLVLSPGNKSEIAMGYNTLYGDTVGALAPIADLYKDDVYRLAATFGDVIPRRVIDRAPSAELRPNQRDDDDLPPYANLDPALRALIEGNASRDGLLAAGFAPHLVDEVLRRFYLHEHKRRQLPPGIKVTPKAFGSGRRVPITNAYRH